MREWGVFPYVPTRLLWDIRRSLCYTAHGGSGYSFSVADVGEMSWAEALYHLKELGVMRQKEADAIAAAHRGK